jgi:hypothetical protein
MTPSVDRYDECQLIPSRNLSIFDPPHFHPSAITPGLCTRKRADVQGGVRGISARGVGVSDHEGIGLTQRGYSQAADQSQIAVGGKFPASTIPSVAEAVWPGDSVRVGVEPGSWLAAWPTW